MANDELNNKNTSNLKVPPLKIVLSSHQSNAVLSIKDPDQTKVGDRDSNGESHSDRKDSSARRASIGINDGSDKYNRKGLKGSSSSSNDSDLCDATSKAQNCSSPSSSSSSSDRSASATPSSESESVASNSTIISDPPQTKVTIKVEETNQTRQDRAPRSATKNPCGERAGPNSNKRSLDNSLENSNDVATNKDQTTTASQRITRSSQRAAQQNKTDVTGEANGEDSALSENIDKLQESARKVKRRKADQQESEQDGNQSTAPPQLAMAKICPEDYQLPSQNSFELYRDIRKRPYTKLMKLNYIQPKVPHGFKDYLINSGPYLLDGNKLGVGLTGAKLDNLGNQIKNSDGSTNRLPLRMKLSNLQKLSFYQPSSHQRHTSYVIPQITAAPKSLKAGSPLYELFQDQEKARHQMRIQHLKERERSILAAEQEMLRAYNKAAIADVKQKLHLSACTYLYYQEKYHYLDEKRSQNGCSKSKEVPHCQDNSFLCIEGGEAKSSESTSLQEKSSANKDSREPEVMTRKEESEVPDSTIIKESSSDKVVQIKSEAGSNQELHQEDNASNQGDQLKETKSGAKSNGSDSESVKDHAQADNKPADQDPKESSKVNNSGDLVSAESDGNVLNSKNSPGEEIPKEMTDEELRDNNKEVFLGHLQEIDDKWAKIKKDMLVRHRNEAESLYAVQTLEWEWKVKEIGACDVRVSPRIELEFVPRVEVAAIDY